MENRHLLERHNVIFLFFLHLGCTYSMFFNVCTLTTCTSLPCEVHLFYRSTNMCVIIQLQIDKFDILGFQSCCDQHDTCYDMCGSRKDQCDNSFKKCLNDVCDLKTSSLSQKSRDGKFDLKLR